MPAREAAAVGADPQRASPIRVQRMDGNFARKLPGAHGLETFPLEPVQAPVPHGQPKSAGGVLREAPHKVVIHPFRAAKHFHPVRAQADDAVEAADPEVAGVVLAQGKDDAAQGRGTGRRFEAVAALDKEAAQGARPELGLPILEPDAHVLVG